MAQYPTISLNLKTIDDNDHDHDDLGLANNPPPPAVPSLCGIPLKYISLITLAVQNSALTIIMHYSRVSTPSSRAYSAATAVLMNEILKGLISLVIAFVRIDTGYPHDMVQAPSSILTRLRKLSRDVFSQDCWKLSIPAILYVIQNNLQYVAASNLEAATFQVTYQMKILTTAAFSVLLLRKKLSPAQWLSLLFLAIGVGVVQIQDLAPTAATVSVGPKSMDQMKGFIAVVAACFTSGLAGVYFEMVLKNSQTDLWVRNVQLSLFSLLPAFAPVVFTQRHHVTRGTTSLFSILFHNFGAWAWTTVSVQVLGGLVTAMVIKYSDNILKGFATSLSIVISFLASVALFDFKMTFTFILGSAIVLVATWLYNQQPKHAGYLKEPIGWNGGRFEKQKSVSSPAVRTPLYGGLTAFSSTSSLSSLSSTHVNVVPLSHSEGKDLMRKNVAW
ncbi:nucleotide-sugar transporter-domain-containing protein [Crucibulum laeve]|uniref:Nucleotide-sugar transporter-domain-containing protein n=1 Tax=Crucibulum laeve TaxID=68775 RepID=A0A5C3MC76_9AGAR|nr:nucleotide-sugar transporter-domain-containing protein [Crucibulum laeve]